MARAALKVVERLPFFERQEELYLGDGFKNAHSLHNLKRWPGGIIPDLCSHLVKKFTQRGDVVLDPFCGGGHACLETALLGRVAIGSDPNPLAVAVARARMEVADISEVALRIQQLNLQRPIDLRLYTGLFEPFYDVDTFRELVNLRSSLKSRFDRIDRFIQLLALSLLYGNSAGSFSAYSFPQVSLTPEEQQTLNNKRGQYPDYRAVGPRILKKAAMVLRDGIPSVLQRYSAESRYLSLVPNDLAPIPTASVDLVLTKPPLPGLRDISAHMWLDFWFTGTSLRQFSSKLWSDLSVRGWLDRMNGTLLELARVTRPGGRAALDLRLIRVEGQEISLDQVLRECIDTNLGGFWETEGVLVQEARSPQLKGTRLAKKELQQHRVLLLRRR